MDQGSGAKAFSDHFSEQARDYEQFRPGYPPQLFEFLAGVAPGTEHALDVATGNGQAAIELARHFAAVRATDPSEAQLCQARLHERVTYAREPAEQIDAADRSFDLVTAAQAAHWFDFERFYTEVCRVLKPGGVLALWTYEMFRSDDRLDALLADFYRNVTGPYWPRQRHHVEECYARLPFPLQRMKTPGFSLLTQWDCGQALGYIGTWSAVVRYRRLRHSDPLVLLEPRLRQAWGSGPRGLVWKIHLLAGRDATDRQRQAEQHAAL